MRFTASNILASLVEFLMTASPFMRNSTESIDEGSEKEKEMAGNSDVNDTQLFISFSC